MNNTLGLENGIEILNFTLGEYLDFLGNLEYIDIGYLYLLTSIAFIGTILNIKCIVIFTTRDFSTLSLFYYYKVIAFNNALHCFIGIFYGLCLSPRYVPYEYQYGCVQYQIPFLVFHSIFFFYSGVLEVAALFDRLKVFDKRIKNCMKYKPKTICLIFLVISPFICSFAGIIYEPKQLCWYSFSNDTYVKDCFYTLRSSNFAFSEFGFIFITVNTIIRDFPILILIIILNKILIDCLNNYCTGIGSIFPNQTNRQHQLIRSNRPITMMAILESVLTMIPRIILAIATLYYIISPDYVSVTLLTIADILIFVGAAGSFFIYYNFNHKFRNKYLNSIRRLF
jgi:hypothetical protein